MVASQPRAARQRRQGKVVAAAHALTLVVNSDRTAISGSVATDFAGEITIALKQRFLSGSESVFDALHRRAHG